MSILIGAIAAAAASLFHGVWAWARADIITVTSKSLLLNPIAGSFFLIGGAAGLFLRAQTRRGRATAVLLTALPAWLPAIFQFVFTASANLLVFRPRIGVPIYNYHLSLTAFFAAIILVVISGCSSPFWQGLSQPPRPPITELASLGNLRNAESSPGSGCK